MFSAQDYTATQNEYSLTITSAHGTVVKDPDKTTYHEGDIVQLSVSAETGWSFASWSGALSGNANPASITIHGNTAISANYIKNAFQISGNAGVAGASLTYTGGTTVADATGAYAFIIANGWSGTVTPSKPGYTFTPNHKTYTSVAADLSAEDYVATAVASFEDVPTTFWAWKWIEILSSNGITSGCSTSPALFCPAGTVTRDQMAIFLLRAKHGTGYHPPAATGLFEDVPVTHWAAAWIEQLASEGVTSGCSVSPKLFCPSSVVTRDQLAVFLLRAEHGKTYAPPAASGIFEDVPADFWAAAWIEQLTTEGITSGCSSTPKLYCPGTQVTRDQMAVFLVKTFGLH